MCLMSKFHYFCYFYFLIIMTPEVSLSKLKLFVNLHLIVNTSEALPKNSTDDSGFQSAVGVYKFNSTELERIEPKPIYLTTWAKYFVYRGKSSRDSNRTSNNTYLSNSPVSVNETSTNVSAFYVNEAFVHNEVHKDAALARDQIDFINNPNEFAFFFILTRKNINVLTSRQAEKAKTIDLIDLKEIKPITINERTMIGGVEDAGDYTEGFCIDISVLNDKIFTVCLDSSEEKRKWMSTLYRVLRLTSQIKDNEALNKAQAQTAKNNITLASFLKDVNSSNAGKANNIARWIAIAPWSECTKQCGGGSSYLKRICIMPEELEMRGREIINPQSSNIKYDETLRKTSLCSGEPLLTKECNLNPCLVSAGNQGKVNKNIAEVETSGEEILKDPQIKFIPASSKHLRYEKCVIKEGDLALMLESGNLKGAKIPVRVLLNPETLSVYSSDDYKSLIISFNLLRINHVGFVANDPSCFEISEGSKSSALCAFTSKYKPLQELIKEWKEDVLLFIRECSKSSGSLDYIESEDDNSESSTLDFYAKKQEIEIEKIISKTQNMAVSALEKELKVESIIEKEEDSKDILLQGKWQKELEKTKQQQEEIQKQLEIKRKEATLYSKKLALKKKIDEIKSQVQEQINKVRNDLKARLLRKRKDKKREQELYQQKILEIKKDISESLIKAAKEGDYEVCDPELPSTTIVKYCKNNFASVFKQNECVKSDNYCYYCCENEFGELHYDQRAVCKSKCEDYYTKQIRFSSKPKLRFADSKANEIIQTNNEAPKKVEAKEENSEIASKAKTFQVNETLQTPNPQVEIDKAIENAEKMELLKSIKLSLDDIKF